MAKAEKTPDKKKKVEGTFAEAWKPQAIGDTLTGVYLGAQEAIGKRGPFSAYHIKTEDGRRLSVSGASLKTIMPQIPRKTQVTITFAGYEKMDKGDMKVFEVEIPEGTQLIDPFDDEDDEG